MGCLMNDEADATYLSEKGIIQNYVGNGSDVSQFFKFICKDVAFDMSNSYLKEEFEGINNYTSNRWNVECARFKNLHFDSPWTVLSSFAVLAAILLSILQTIFGGLSYLHHLYAVVCTHL
ncbi:BnaC06g42160D [Brassica napus]|nr:BnaC06g42160D [Brassica napus]